MLSDRLKDTLSHYTRCYVANRESQDWLRPQRIAELVDLYEVERGSNSNKVKFQQPYRPNNSLSNTYKYDKQYGSSYRKHSDSDSSEPQGHHYWREQITCFKCAGKGHMGRDCPTKVETETVPKQFNNKNQYPNKGIPNATYRSTNSYNKNGASNTPSTKGRTISCFLCGQPNHKVQDCPKNINKTRSVRVQEESLDDDVDDQASKAMATNHHHHHIIALVE